MLLLLASSFLPLVLKERCVTVFVATAGSGGGV